MKNLLKKILWYSEEQYIKLSNTNLNAAILLFCGALSYALFSLVFAIIHPDRSQLNGVDTWSYAALLIVWSISGLIWSLYLRVNKKDSILDRTMFSKNTAMYYNMSFYFILTYVYMVLADNKIKPLMVFGIIIGMYTLTAQISPYILGSIYLLQYILSVKYIYNNIGKPVAILSFVFISIHIIFVYIKSIYMRAVFEKTKELEKLNNETKAKYLKQLQINNDMQKSTITKLADLIEVRDGETGEHTKRTSELVNMISKELVNEGKYTDILNNGYIEMITYLSMLHDIGKIKISDVILNAPRKLTDEEFEIMKLHTIYGKQIINEILFSINEDMPIKQIAGDIALYHHEKWNGKGYPVGLVGESIPLHARIMSVADVFDAVISKRVYKEAFSIDKAFKIIEEGSGNHFDPNIVKAFLNLRPEIIKMLKK